MNKIKIIFFGTHNFAETILRGLIDSPLFDIKLVITQPDKAVGRKKELISPPVKILATKNKIKVEQPATLKNYKIENSKYDLGITAQYGLLIPENILNTPIHGTLNIHTSLLPKYRGASPIQSAIINGETKTGVTIIKMDKGLDTGPILLQKELNIAPDETYIDIDQKLAKIGIFALLEAVSDYVSGKLQPKEQNNSQASTCRQFTRDDGQIDWKKTAQEIYNQYRGLTPWPGIWTTWQDKRIKLLKIKPDTNINDLQPGEVNIIDKQIFVGTGKNAIKILELQLEGKPVATAKNFINGHSKINGDILE